MIKDTLFSSAYDEWETPRDFFSTLDREFHFTLDVASSDKNALCENHFTKEQDGLKQSWKTSGTVWCNPPYGRGIDKWMRKAYEESRGGANRGRFSSRPYRHKMVSRLGVPQSGTSVHQRPPRFRQRRGTKEPRTVSVNACHLSRRGGTP